MTTALETLRAVSYSRNSSGEQKSITEQAAENRKAAQENGWDLVAELGDPLSASRYSRRKRGDWAELLAMLPTIDVVILWESSRGDRTLATWAGFLDACRAHGVLVHVVTHHRTYDPRRARDYRTLAEDGVDSAYESDKTSERTARSVATVLAHGLPHGVLTYGYKRRYAERGQLIDQVPDPVTSAVVVGIYEAVAEGESLRAITARLVRDGVKTPKGGRVWYGSSLASIIRNPAYRPHPDDAEHACRSHRGRVIDRPAAWPPLVTESLWAAANLVLGTNDERARLTRRKSAPGQIKYMLSGNSDIMVSPCGSLLSGWFKPDSTCCYYACRFDKCVTAPMVECDEFVSRLVVGRLSRKDARHLWVADDAASRRAADELARLRADLAQNTEDYRAGVISARLAGAREAELEPLIEDADRRSRPAGAPLAALKLIDAAKFGEDVRGVWDAFPVTARREVVASMFETLTLGPVEERISRKASPEERLDIVSARIQFEWRKP